MPVPALRVSQPDLGNILLDIERIKGARAQNVLRQRQAETFGEDRNFLLREKERKVKAAEEERGFRREEFGFKKETAGRKKKQDELQFETDLLEYAVASGQGIGIEEYPQYRENLIRFGMDPGLFPESFATPQDFEAWRQRALLTAKERITLNKAPDTEMQTIYGPDGQTARVPVKKGAAYAPPEGWSLSKPGKAGAGTDKTGSRLKRISGIEKALAELDAADSVSEEKLAEIDDPVIAAIFAGSAGKKLTVAGKQKIRSALQREKRFLESKIEPGTGRSSDDPFGLR